MITNANQIEMKNNYIKAIGWLVVWGITILIWSTVYKLVF